MMKKDRALSLAKRILLYCIGFFVCSLVLDPLIRGVLDIKEIAIRSVMFGIIFVLIQERSRRL